MDQVLWADAIEDHVEDAEWLDGAEARLRADPDVSEEDASQLALIVGQYIGDIDKSRMLLADMFGEMPGTPVLPAPADED